MRKSGRLARLLAALMVGPCGVCFAEPDVAPAQPSESEKLFLDRLMMAEIQAAACMLKIPLLRPMVLFNFSGRPSWMS